MKFGPIAAPYQLSQCLLAFFDSFFLRSGFKMSATGTVFRLATNALVVGEGAKIKATLVVLVVSVITGPRALLAAAAEPCTAQPLPPASGLVV